MDFTMHEDSHLKEKTMRADLLFCDSVISICITVQWQDLC